MVKVVHETRQQVDFSQVIECIENEDPVISGLKFVTDVGQLYDFKNYKLPYLYVLVWVIVSYLSPALMETDYISCVQVMLGEHVLW